MRTRTWSALSVLFVMFSVPATVALPETLETWSTNLDNLENLQRAEIATWTEGAQVSIDRTNVNSGGVSVRNSGRLDSRHILQTVFTIRGLTGQEEVDLSDKTFRVETYVPADSPLSSLAIEFGAGKDSLVARANIPIRKGQWQTVDVDVALVLSLDSWQISEWMHSPGVVSSEDAAALLGAVQYIKIDGGPSPTMTGPANTWFLIDLLGWEPSPALPDANDDSLRKRAEARELLVGSYVDIAGAGDPRYLGTFLREMGTVLRLNHLWPTTEPAAGNWEAAVRWPEEVFFQRISEMAGTLPIRYAAGGMDNSSVAWLRAKSYKDAKTVLDSYIRAQVTLHKGETKIWCVFNELLRYDIGYKSYAGLGLKDRAWASDATMYWPFSSSPSDVSLIEDAFRTARETDPDALLFLCDGAVEEMGQARPDALYNLAARLVKDGTPIDGVAMQTHLLVGKDGKIRPNAGGDYALSFSPTEGFRNIARNVERYAALGLKVMFSEVDVPVWMADVDSTAAGQQRLAARLKVQTDVYRSLMRIALSHPNVISFILWSWSDAYSWTTADPYWHDYGNPGVFDADYQPKPAYHALMEELARD